MTQCFCVQNFRPRQWKLAQAKLGHVVIIVRKYICWKRQKCLAFQCKGYWFSLQNDLKKVYILMIKQVTRMTMLWSNTSNLRWPRQWPYWFDVRCFCWCVQVLCAWRIIQAWPLILEQEKRIQMCACSRVFVFVQNCIFPYNALKSNRCQKHTIRALIQYAWMKSTFWQIFLTYYNEY